MLPIFSKSDTSDSILLNSFFKSDASDSVSLNDCLQSNASDSVSLNTIIESNALGSVSPKKKPQKSDESNASLWSERQFIFADEQSLLEFAQFLAERKRLVREFPLQLAKSPTQIQRWRALAKRKKIGWLAVLLSLLRGFEVVAVELLTLLDNLIELSAEGAFYTHRYDSNYSRSASVVWTGSYTSSVRPPYSENYSSTDVVKQTQVCNVKIKTRKAKIDDHLHSFYKGVSMTVVAGRAPPSPIRLAA